MVVKSGSLRVCPSFVGLGRRPFRSGDPHSRTATGGRGRFQRPLQSQPGRLRPGFFLQAIRGLVALELEMS